MKKIWSVSEISNAIKEGLEAEFFDISVVGEVSGLKWHSSGHVYFSLIGKSCSLNVAFFRRYVDRLSFALADGMRIVASGNISSYPPRSNYQLICRKITPEGEGEKLIKLMNLKRQLKEEGLFEKHRALPDFPKKIAIITSPSGAAIEDIKSVLKRRFGGMKLFIFGALVEGNQAAGSIINAINRVKANTDLLGLELLIIARGGGSKESLDLFNDEQIARLIYTVKIPVVSAIGHQIDETVTDLVADYRVETPTAAAELITPDIDVLKRRYDEVAYNFKRSVKHYFEQKYLALGRLSDRISYQSLINFFDIKSQKTDFAIYSLNAVFRVIIAKKRERYAMAIRQIETLKMRSVDIYKAKLHNFTMLMRMAGLNYLNNSRLRLSRFVNVIETLSPVATLKRGYSITLKDNRLVKLPDIEPGDTIVTELYDGTICSKVTKKDTFQQTFIADD